MIEPVRRSEAHDLPEPVPAAVVPPKRHSELRNMKVSMLP